MGRPENWRDWAIAYVDGRPIPLPEHWFVYTSSHPTFLTRPLPNDYTDSYTWNPCPGNRTYLFSPTFNLENSMDSISLTSGGTTISLTGRGMRTCTGTGPIHATIKTNHTSRSDGLLSMPIKCDYTSLSLPCLGTTALGSNILANFSGKIAVAGYFAPRDNYQHVIVATNDGNSDEMWFPGLGGPVGLEVLASYPVSSPVGVAGYFASRDNYQHVIVATNDGQVHEKWFPGSGKPGGEDVLASYPASSIVGVAGYFAPRDNYQHVIVATNDGQVHEKWFPGSGKPGGEDVLASYPAGSIVGVAGYFATRGNYQHVIVATNDGQVHEVYWKGLG